jgi:tRNA (Thr-GGU) A37 N-methylase
MPFWVLPLLKNWKAIAVTVVAFFVISYLHNEIKEARQIIELENRVEEQESYIETRKDIDDAVKGLGNLDDTSALEWLRDRNGHPKPR